MVYHFLSQTKPPRPQNTTNIYHSVTNRPNRDNTRRTNTRQVRPRNKREAQELEEHRMAAIRAY